MDFHSCVIIGNIRYYIIIYWYTPFPHADTLEHRPLFQWPQCNSPDLIQLSHPKVYTRETQMIFGNPHVATPSFIHNGMGKKEVAAKPHLGRHRHNSEMRHKHAIYNKKQTCDQYDNISIYLKNQHIKYLFTRYQDSYKLQMPSNVYLYFLKQKRTHISLRFRYANTCRGAGLHHPCPWQHHLTATWKW